MDGKSPNPNPKPSSNPHNHKQAILFLKSLYVINQITPRPYWRKSIRRAAYASMAYAAGSRRVWRRALIIRLRRGGSTFRRGVVVGRRPMRVATRLRVGEPRRSDDLRRLVPGGDAMDFGSLLEETASYVQSLSAQVELMSRIVDSASHY